jgi:hypothetical protein
MLTISSTDGSTVVPLIGDNTVGELESFIYKFIPPDSYMPWTRRSFPSGALAMLTYPAGFMGEPSFRINRFRWPTGAARWAYGHFLCSSDAIGQINSIAYNQNGQYNQVLLSIGNPESGPGIGINPGGGSGSSPGETMTANVYVLPATPLSGVRGLTGTIQSLYLLTIVDARYFWWWNPFNYGGVGAGTTWQNLIDAIKTALNVTITVDTINAKYLNPSVQMYSLPYEPIPPVLDSIAYNIGMRVCVNYTGGVFLMLYNTALGVFNNDMAANPNRLILSGGARFSSPL